MALADLKRAWLLKQLGLSASTLAESDLLNQLYGNQQTSEMEGNGFPEGVVSAPVGSTYIDRAATNGAVLWAKKSGTGNTGWQVVYGDTGYRNIGSLLGSQWSTPNYVVIRRVNNEVHFGFNANPVATITAGDPSFNILTQPLVGFGPSMSSGFIIAVGDFPIAISSSGSVVTWDWILNRTVGSFDPVLQNNNTLTNGIWLRGSHRWVTDQSWPSALPGVAG